MQQYIRKNEHFTPPSDRHNTTGEFDPAVHGFKGVNSVSLSGFKSELDARVIEASKQSNGEFRFNLDYNGVNQLEISFAQSTVLNGTRSSAATSYLAPKYVQRPNLHVLLPVHAHVTRVLSTHNTLSFDAVEFSQDNGETVHRVAASKGIVLSADSIGTPSY